MFHLIKLLLLLAGLAAAAYFFLPYFGYEININYFTDSKDACQTRLNQCTKEYLEQGTKNAKCDFNCVDPKLIINKK